MGFHDYDIAKNLAAFDENIFIEELFAMESMFSEQMGLMVNEALKHAVNKTDFFHIYEWLLDPIKWRMPKVSLDTFLDDPHYLGAKTDGGKSIYKMIRVICREVIEGGYAEAIELAGIGTGKSMSSQIMAAYQVHHLLCLRDPHNNYGLTADKPLVVINMGPTASQALDIVFSGIKSFIEGSPFFMQHKPSIQQTTIKFGSTIGLISGNSKVTTSIGYNVFAAVLDEAAFYLDNDDKNVAEEIYNSLQKRITSRLRGKGGLLMGISSPRYEGDFITEKVKIAKQLESDGRRKYRSIYAIQLQSRKAKEFTKSELKDAFFFDARKCAILENTNYDKLKSEGYTVNRIQDAPVSLDDDIWEIPNYLIQHFQQSPEGAKRDYGAIPSTSISGFFSNPAKITTMFNMNTPNPVIAPGQYKFEARPLRVPYFIHIDIGFNRDGKGDHAGFCMGHFGGWIKDDLVNEYRMKFVIDVTEQIGIIGDTGEIDLSDLRQRIYTLKDMGYFIKLITFDQFASKDFRQIIEKKGFRTDYVSVDRDTGPYDILKAAIYEERIDIPYDAVVERELKQLELIKGTKVDHPPSGSKDVGDALAGVCWNISENTPKGGISIQNVIQNESKENSILSHHRALKAKEQYYERVRRQVQKQMEMEQRIEIIQRNIEEKNKIESLF